MEEKYGGEDDETGTKGTTETILVRDKGTDVTRNQAQIFPFLFGHRLERVKPVAVHVCDFLDIYAIVPPFHRELPDLLFDGFGCLAVVYRGDQCGDDLAGGQQDAAYQGEISDGHLHFIKGVYVAGELLVLSDSLRDHVGGISCAPVLDDGIGTRHRVVFAFVLAGNCPCIGHRVRVFWGREAPLLRLVDVMDVHVGLVLSG